MTDTDKIQKPFGDWAKSIQKRLNLEYEASSSILSHGSAIGTIREKIVEEILLSFLPRSLEIGTGQIVNLQGDLSGQIDIIIAKDTTPVFRYAGGISAFLLETVLATIEVKSMMHGSKLHEALNNSRSVKSLTP